MEKVLPSQRLFKQFEEQVVLGEVGLSDVVRLGAQLMLQHAVELEMTTFLRRGYYQNEPETTQRHGRRNGYEKRSVLTGEGPIEIRVPQVRDLPTTAARFQSKILEAYACRTETLDELITRMYVTGMSTRDIETVFADVMAGRGVSRNTVSHITERLSEDLEAFRRRDLSGEPILYLFLDGTYLRYHLEAERKEPVLVAYGIRENARKVLLHVGPGHRESYDSWKTFLHEMTGRGLRTPLMVVTDGNPGLVRAVSEIFPLALRQRCQRHKMNNILSKVPKTVWDVLKKEIRKVFDAKSYEEGLRLGRALITKCGKRFPAAMLCLEEDLEACLQCLKLPPEHRKRVRTTNVLERLFGEGRRRLKVIPHFFTETAGLKLVYATLLATSRRWSGVAMNPIIARDLTALWKNVFGQSREETWAA